jgi:hypothetical protein
MQIDGPPMFPVSDGGGGHTELGRHLFLVKSVFEPAATEVVAEGDGFLVKLWKLLNLQ